MGKIYFIADTHFGDLNIINYENRPFIDLKDMELTLIERWNSVVTNEDKVFIVGDFVNGKNDLHVVKSLKGDKYLIRGNHDILSNAEYRESGLKEVYDYPIIIEGYWILSHEPLYVNKNMPYVNVFGHVHNNPSYRDYSSHSICVSVEREHMFYTPLSLKTMKDYFK